MTMPTKRRFARLAEPAGHGRGRDLEPAAAHRLSTVRRPHRITDTVLAVRLRSNRKSTGKASFHEGVSRQHERFLSGEHGAETQSSAIMVPWAIGRLQVTEGGDAPEEDILAAARLVVRGCEDVEELVGHASNLSAPAKCWAKARATKRWKTYPTCIGERGYLSVSFTEYPNSRALQQAVCAGYKHYV
ncbi:unnamed protein product, partial [Symbiodinium sp. KB8]